MSVGRRLPLLAAFTFWLVSAAASAQLASTCDASLWDHVYHPARLVKLHDCMTVTGTIVLKRPEKDGDIHIQLKLDKKFLPLLNATNKSRQGGNLVLEPICVGNVTQADAIQPCQGLTNQVAIPKKGDHVAVTGTFVHDIEGGHGWMEIHPVTKIEPN
jgi:hypothetical protein